MMRHRGFPALSLYRGRSVTGFTQIEIVASTALLGVLFTAALTSVAASRTRANSEMARLQAQSLANELLAEILSLPARDPENGTSSTLGLESGESNGVQRSKWDDVDDYHNLSESPPRNREGINVTGYTNWSRSTIVERIQSSNWTLVSSAYDQAYRVTVQVSRNGNLLATATGYKNGDQRTSSPLQGP